MPPRLRELAARLKPENIILHAPSSGSHWKFVGPDGKTYPVPAHNGERTEISREYIRGLCRCFQLPRSLLET